MSPTDQAPAAAPRRRFNHAIWIGPVLTAVGAVSYFTYFARFPALRDFPWVNLPLALAGVAISGAGLGRALFGGRRLWGRIFALVGFAFSLGLFGLFAVYLFGWSYGLPGPTTTSRELTLAPDFALRDQQGRLVRLADYRGSKVVLVFFRGHW